MASLEFFYCAVMLAHKLVSFGYQMGSFQFLLRDLLRKHFQSQVIIPRREQDFSFKKQLVFDLKMNRTSLEWKGTAYSET